VHLSRADPEVDYDAFFAALRDAGYSGPLVFETEAEELPGSVEHVRPALRRQGLN
jgi:sugar phosphate isomerase/epimerase